MMMMMLSQDEIDSLLSNLSVATTSNPQPQAAQNAKPSITAGGSQSGIERPKNTLSIADILSEEKQKNYKIYNFKRPDKFSKDTLRALETLHETFSRNVSLLLAAYLRTSVTSLSARCHAPLPWALLKCLASSINNCLA
jgi:flagellar motor switch protein FliM